MKDIWDRRFVHDSNVQHLIELNLRKSPLMHYTPYRAVLQAHEAERNKIQKISQMHLI